MFTHEVLAPIKTAKNSAAYVRSWALNSCTDSVTLDQMSCIMITDWQVWAPLPLLKTRGGNFCSCKGPLLPFLATWYRHCRRQLSLVLEWVVCQFGHGEAPTSAEEVYQCNKFYLYTNPSCVVIPRLRPYPTPYGVLQGPELKMGHALLFTTP